MNWVGFLLLLQAVNVWSFQSPSPRLTNQHHQTQEIIKYPHTNTASRFNSQKIQQEYQFTRLYSESDDDGESITSSSSTSLSTPLDRPLLAVIDVVALFIFAAIGKASHAPDGSLDIPAIGLTAFPFVLSWLATSPLTGVYSSDDNSGNVIQDTVVKTAKGWIVAVPLGCVLRGVIKGYVPPVPFVIVTMIATLVIVGGARVAFAFAEDFFVELVN